MKKIKPFNLYYLNLSKVYEISMMINNTVLTNVNTTSESSKKENNTNEIKLDFGLGNKKFLSDITSGFSLKKEKGQNHSNKIDQSFEVKTTKSTLLSLVLSKAREIKDLENLNEGDLIKIDNIKLSLVDSEKTRTTKFLKNDIFKGFEMEELKGFDLNNLINEMLKDQAFILEAEIAKSKIAFKIPQSVENEFENQYSLDDILFSNVAIVGIYKGKLPLEPIKSNIFEYFSNKGKNDYNNVEIGTEDNNQEEIKEDYNFIDIISITQDLNFDNEIEPVLKWWQVRKKIVKQGKRFFNFLNEI